MSTKSTSLTFICKSCGKEFRLEPSRVRDRGTVLHCSWQCRYGGDKPYLVCEKPLYAPAKMAKQNLADVLVIGTRKDKNGCILWNGELSEHGYGLIASKHRAHRVSFELFIGPIPDGLKVLHTCDVRNCVNPNHLFIGTLADNVYDMVAKGRNVKGSRSNFAKLKEEQVIELRRIAATGMDRKEIAKMFNIDLSTVYCIVRRSRWKTL